VGVQGDFRTYHHPAIIWSQTKKTDWKTLKEVSAKIINNLKTVNRLIYSAEEVPQLQLSKLYLEKDNLNELRAVDAILRAKTDELPDIWQMPVVQLPLLDENNQRCYLMRPVCSQDAMSADVYEMDPDYMDEIIIDCQKIPGIGRIFYDITTKPPGTIEWE
jgi:GMP synthase (glutamine-hydrolysing)